jgi:hypothetical protein
VNLERDKQRFLVLYDYGTGGVWMFLWARSKEEIERKFSRLQVIDDPPGWLDDPRRARMECEFTFDIDHPRGWLAEYGDNLT